MGVPPPATNGPSSGSPSRAPSNANNEPKLHDPNMSNPRLLVNRACIYERQLPGDAYITAHVQRLQHGYYSTPDVSDLEAEHVDFLALSFVFHSAHTLSHRSKSATIRAGIHGSSVRTSSKRPSRPNPRFLMHAPHLIYGTVSPETMEWTFSLAGSLGISETPVSASIIPSGSLNKSYRRYEMMRIQGSVRTLKSPRGSKFDVEAGEILWSLEENNLQRSGLPREFTFVMLIQKPAANSKISLSLDIDPVIDAWWGSYPRWLLALASYRPVQRRGVDFSQEVGQRFEPVNGKRGFNFAALVSSFDDYIAMPGRKCTRSIQLPPEAPLPPPGNLPQSYPGQYGSVNPLQQIQGNNLANALLNSQLQRLNTQVGAPTEMPPAATTTLVGTTNAIPAENHSGTINIRLGLDPAMISQLSAFRPKSPPVRTRSPELPSYQVGGGVTGVIGTSQTPTTAATASSWPSSENDCASPDWPPMHDQSYENARASMLRTVHPGVRKEDRVASSAKVHQVMNLANLALSPGLLATLSERNNDA